MTVFYKYERGCTYILQGIDINEEVTDYEQSCCLHESDARRGHAGAATAVARLKQEPGKDLVVMGSGELVQSLMRHNLVDEYVLLIHPLVLGSGRRLFADGGAFAALRLVDTKTTTTGVVIATYQPTEQTARKTTDAVTH